MARPRQISNGNPNGKRPPIDPLSGGRVPCISVAHTGCLLLSTLVVEDSCNKRGFSVYCIDIGIRPLLAMERDHASLSSPATGSLSWASHETGLSEEHLRRAIRKKELKAVGGRGRGGYRISKIELADWWREQGGGKLFYEPPLSEKTTDRS